MENTGLKIENLAPEGDELSEEQLLAVSGGHCHSQTTWVACGCPDTDKAF